MDKINSKDKFELEKIECNIVRNKLENLSLQTFYYENNIHTFEFISKLHYYLFCDTTNGEQLRIEMNEEN